MTENTYRGNPCYGCEDRVSGCHSICNRYADWKAEVGKRIQDKVAFKTKEKIINSVETSRRAKLKKIKGKEKYKER